MRQLTHCCRRFLRSRVLYNPALGSAERRAGGETLPAPTRGAHSSRGRVKALAVSATCRHLPGAEQESAARSELARPDAVDQQQQHRQQPRHEERHAPRWGPGTEVHRRHHPSRPIVLKHDRPPHSRARRNSGGGPHKPGSRAPSTIVRDITSRARPRHHPNRMTCPDRFNSASWRRLPLFGGAADCRGVCARGRAVPQRVRTQVVCETHIALGIAPLAVRRAGATGPASAKFAPGVCFGAPEEERDETDLRVDCRPRGGYGGTRHDLRFICALLLGTAPRPKKPQTWRRFNLSTCWNPTAGRELGEDRRR